MVHVTIPCAAACSMLRPATGDHHAQFVDQPMSAFRRVPAASAASTTQSPCSSNVAHGNWGDASCASCAGSPAGRRTVLCACCASTCAATAAACACVDGPAHCACDCSPWALATPVRPCARILLCVIDRDVPAQDHSHSGAICRGVRPAAVCRAVQWVAVLCGARGCTARG